jgi:hypothetical protein
MHVAVSSIKNIESFSMESQWTFFLFFLRYLCHCQQYEIHLAIRVKVKVKVLPITGHEGPEGE